MLCDNRHFVFSRYLTIALLSIIFLFSLTLETNACNRCRTAISNADSDIWQESQDNFDGYLDREFKLVERFIVRVMWEQNILPIMMLAAEQFTVVALQQAMIVGMFIDAESQMDAQRLLQELRAKVLKDYQPSVGMCEFGSVMKSLAASEIRGETFAVVLSRRSQERHLGKGDSSGAYGNDLDHSNRIMHFKRLFCNEKDRRGSLASVCDNDVSWGNSSFDAVSRSRINKDIDYFSLMDSPWNLSVDFTNQTIADYSSSPQILNEDEEHIMAMSSNLFGHTIFPRPPTKIIENHEDNEISPVHKYYMDMRSIIAKRSVAENSLYAIAAMKSMSPDSTSPSGGGGACEDNGNSGSSGCKPCVDKDGYSCPAPGSTAVPSNATGGGPPNSRIYMEHIMKHLGIPDAEILDLLGYNPSYYAQMEILTKKIYQDPKFYTNLYDTPANVERKSVALQAIKLMQKFDMLKSHLRGEVTASILLELAVTNLQNEIEDQINAISVDR